MYYTALATMIGQDVLLSEAGEAWILRANKKP
jgi:hypothetical protein